jgi:hypothetical protein
MEYKQTGILGTPRNKLSVQNGFKNTITLLKVQYGINVHELFFKKCTTYSDAFNEH